MWAGTLLCAATAAAAVLRCQGSEMVLGMDTCRHTLSRPPMSEKRSSVICTISGTSSRNVCCQFHTSAR